MPARGPRARARPRHARRRRAGARAGSRRRPRGCGTRTRGPAATPAAKRQPCARAWLERGAGHQPERPGAERQHLDVVAVVAQAVARHERGAEGAVETGDERRPRARDQEREANQAGQVGEIEEHATRARTRARGRARPRAARRGGISGCRCRAPAARTRDARCRRSTWSATIPRERAVGRDRGPGAAGHDGEPEEEGERQRQAEPGGRPRRERRTAQRAPARAQPDQERRRGGARAAARAAAPAASDGRHGAPTSNQRRHRSAQSSAAQAPAQAGASFMGPERLARAGERPHTAGAGAV